MARESTARRPTAVDAEIGRRLSQLRTYHGISQSELAKKAGLAMQQIQKYERAKDRISASRLKSFADIFYVSLDYFFDEPKQPHDRRKDILPLIEAGHGDRLMKAFTKIKDARNRRAIIRLVEDLAAEDS